MSGAKKLGPVVEDPINAKIQRKFDLVFTPVTPVVQKEDSTRELSTVFNSDDIDFTAGDDMGMEDNKKSSSDDSSLQIDLDFSMDEESAPIEKIAVAESKNSNENDEGLDFSLDFDDAEIENHPEATQTTDQVSPENEGFSLDDVVSEEMEFDEATKKTMIVSPEHMTSNLTEFSLDDSAISHSSAELMSTEEAKANMESTIKDILRPKLEKTKEIRLDELEKGNASPLDQIEDSVLDFGGNTPSQGFVLKNMLDDDNSFSLDTRETTVSEISQVSQMSQDATGEFNLESFDVDAREEVPVERIAEASFVSPPPPVQSFDHEALTPRAIRSTESEIPVAPIERGVSPEESLRVQATIRALREEREELLAQIKSMKAETKELEQDNLTLKANLDEAKIEITILRKRHMVEVEDLKYRLTLSEEKKALADEKARQAELRREKLEQKVRIDFNQVKQREKELESKLELLSMDVDSQIQGRDQKILELRRKIDALEFNMENASIREQKSLDDKRKLEDRLGKIIKTLRHSIKNLEDDIDHAHEDDHQNEKN